MRRLSLAALALVVVAGVGHTLAWRWADQRLRSGFAAWVGQRRAEGWTVRSGVPESGGWPVAARLIVPDLSLAGGQPDIPGGVEFGAGRAVLAVAFLRPRVLTVSFGSAQHIRFGSAPDIPFHADRLQASLPLIQGARAVDIESVNLRAGWPAPEGAPASITVALLQVHLETKPAAPQGEPAISFTASAEDIALPPRVLPGARLWPLGDRIASLSVEGDVSGPLPKAADLATRAAGWRDGGGTLEIRRLALGWGPLGATGGATLALDERMQPMGTANMRLTGQAEALDALVANQAITPGAAKAAKAVFSLMTRAPDGGGAPEVEVPLTLQKQTLSLGRIPLARMTEWIWPTAP